MGEKNAWLEIVLGEGRNRQIHRMLEAEDYSVLRLVRVAIGAVLFGDMPKGKWGALAARDIKKILAPERRLTP